MKTPMLEGRLVPVFVLISSVRADEVSALPDPITTPGAVSTSDLGIICHQRTRERRRVPTSRCDAVFDAYSIPNTAIDRYSYECDHLVPLALGGSNAAANLWPQPNVEAERKDRLEVVMKRMVCTGSLDISKAQSEIADDWTSAYARYVLKTEPPSPPVLRTSSIAKRLTAVVRRLSHSWRFGSERARSRHESMSEEDPASFQRAKVLSLGYRSKPTPGRWRAGLTVGPTASCSSLIPSIGMLSPLFWAAGGCIRELSSRY